MKKGFTLIELITTISMSSVIIFLLINIIISIKNIYSKAELKTEFYINQANLSKTINSKFNKNNLISVTGCSDTDFCYNFSFSDGTFEKLVITSDNKISFGNYVYKLPENARIEKPTLTRSFDIVEDNLDKDNSYITINIPIKSDLYPGIDFGINIVYTYNSNQIQL